MEVRKQEETTTRATKGKRDRPRMEGLGHKSLQQFPVGLGQGMLYQQSYLG